ncbi:hypothetical protein HYN43_028255 [Mucilaginibacter celer]|uniref:Uncharacterized protein n=1 Tax=Mucilaginibacter celer TaxID=2305508 RepID=A0A494VX10_9SPHI|nr:hypothetical protein HYN43_028255 [Mucilaginibacter celer]
MGFTKNLYFYINKKTASVTQQTKQAYPIAWNCITNSLNLWLYIHFQKKRTEFLLLFNSKHYNVFYPIGTA